MRNAPMRVSRGLALAVLFFLVADGSFAQSSGPVLTEAAMEQKPSFKLPVTLVLEGLTLTLAAAPYFEWGQYYSGAVSGGMGVLMLLPVIASQVSSTYQDPWERFALISSGALFVAASAYVFTLKEDEASRRMTNTFVAVQLAVTPFLLRVLFSDEFN